MGGTRSAETSVTVYKTRYCNILDCLTLEFNVLVTAESGVWISIMKVCSALEKKKTDWRKCGYDLVIKPFTFYISVKFTACETRMFVVVRFWHYRCSSKRSVSQRQLSNCELNSSATWCFGWVQAQYGKWSPYITCVKACLFQEAS
jgi:hypothetical protein